MQNIRRDDVLEMRREPLLTKIVREFGAEKLSVLFSGEPLENKDAWRLLELVKQYEYETLYEDEGCDTPDCYIIVLRIHDRFAFMLFKEGEHSKAYLLEVIPPRDYDTAIRLAREKFDKCISRCKADDN